MKCPKCGNEIEEGHVLCEKCGYEIQFVPSYDAVVESQMDETLSGILDGINLENLTEEEVEILSKTMDLDATKDLLRRIELAKTRDLSDYVKEHEKTSLIQINNKKKKILLISCLAGLFVIVAAVILIFVTTSYKNSHTYIALMDAAKTAYNEGDSEKAIDNYLKALKKYPEKEEEIDINLARAYRLTGDITKAVNILNICIERYSMREAYELLVDIYSSQGDYDQIEQLLSMSNDDTLADVFADYVAFVPSFDQPEGVYTEGFVLKILADGPGHIYYTLDGSEPSDESMEYISPITLENGKTVVRAIFYNEKGIKSESITGVYEIVKDVLKQPVVFPQPGAYTRAEYIKVEAIEGCTVHYTDDGSSPDENSKIYDSIILMPLGKSEYKFVTIDESGKKSDITSVKYNLSVDSVCSVQEAINYVIVSLNAVGQLIDITGIGIDGGKYLYDCEGVFSNENGNYYIIREKRTDTDDTQAKNTGSYYAVDTMTTALFRVSKDTNGMLVFAPF